MPAIFKAEVSIELLNCLFDEFHIWEKICDKRIRSRIIAREKSDTYTKASSQIIKHFTTDGKHVATTHRIQDHSGHVYHWDIKDFRLYGIVLWRL